MQTYLIRSSAAHTAENVPALVDDTGEAHKLYGAQSATVVLVRPDGYIGVRTQPASEHALFTYLDDVFQVSAQQPVTLEPVLA